MLANITDQLFFWRRKDEIEDLHKVLVIYVFVFLVWGLYRLLFRLPEVLEETLLKFLVFGVPVFWVVLKEEKKSLADLGMRTKGLLASVYFGLLFGLWLAFLGNVLAFLRDGGIQVNPDISVSVFGNLMLLGLVTAFWEQMLFVGYFLPRLVKDLKGELVALMVMGFMFALIHMPIQLAQGVSLDQIAVRFLLLYSLAVGNGVLYLRFKNLAAPIFAHVAWGSVIYIFG